MAATPDHLRDIAGTMWSFREGGFLCDTVLFADDGLQTNAHSVVLAAASPVFRDALGVDGSKPAAPRTEPHMIQLPGCEMAVIELALSVIYTGTMNPCDEAMREKVVQLLEQLGVKVAAKIERTQADGDDDDDGDDAEPKSVSGYDVIKVEPAEASDNDVTDSDVDQNEDETAETVKSEKEVKVKRQLGHQAPVADGDGDAVIAEIDGNQTTMKIVDENGIEIEEVGATTAIYGGEDGEQPGAFYLIVNQAHHEEDGGGDDEEEEQAEQYDEDVADGLEDGEEAGITESKHVNCPQCGKAFNKINYLETHMRTHVNVKPFECDRCGRGFSQRANLHRHYQGHVGEKPHLCHLCGRSFIQKVQLTEHMASVHAVVVTIGKCYTCRICRQSFAERGHLRQHAVKAHPEAHREAVGAVTEADKAHTCDTCGRGYTTLGALRMHMRVHTGDLMACSMCDKAYVNRALLEQHLRTHTREKAFDCKQCGKAFIYKNALTVHMRTHTGEKPYVCAVCHNSYSQFGHLQSHKKTHTGERPFSCDTCGKAYRQRVDLRLHLKRVHHTMNDSINRKPVVKLVMDESAG